MLIDLHAHCRGSEHIKQNKPLQDFSDTLHNKPKTFAIAFVADGHGGDKYIRSETGSEIAVKCAKERLVAVSKDFLALVNKKKLEEIKKTLKNLCFKILTDWRAKVNTHYSEHPLNPDEDKLCEELKITVGDENAFVLYGTTLLVVAYYERVDFWFALQIGDGKCVAFRDDAENPSVFYPIEEDERLGFGVTTSLCSSRAAEDFRYNCGFDKLEGIAVMTDGLTDSFETEKLPEFIRNIRKNAIENLEATKKELEQFLPKLSERGSGDDISIAAIFTKPKTNADEEAKSALKEGEEAKPASKGNEEVTQTLKEIGENTALKLENVSKEVEKKLETVYE